MGEMVKDTMMAMIKLSPTHSKSKPDICKICSCYRCSISIVLTGLNHIWIRILFGQDIDYHRFVDNMIKNVNTWCANRKFRLKNGLKAFKQNFLFPYTFVTIVSLELIAEQKKWRKYIVSWIARTLNEVLYNYKSNNLSIRIRILYNQN